jgi:hypothetical protein
MNSLLLLTQAASLVFAVVIVFYSFRGLNNCTRATLWKARVPIIVTFSGGCGVILHLLMGNVPHWSFAMMLFALSMRLANERREPLSKLLHSRVIQHP